VKFKTFILVSTVSFSAFILANWMSWNLPLSLGEEEVFGKKVWQKNNCVSCHALFGNGGYVGKDLTHITSKRSKDELLEFFSNPPVYAPNKKKRHPGLSEKDTLSLVSYLEYLNKIPTLGWPPEPKSSREGESL
jgi:nitric oxide reductase subunit C